METTGVFFKSAAAVLFLLIVVLSWQPPASLMAEETTKAELWPEIQPYQTGYLQVSKLHSLFYQLGGNANGKAVMVLHGGPGAGCHPGYFRYFNPEKFHIILHDQRGAGQSKPYAEIKENTTQNLVEDIEKLRKFLKLDKIILFGGSWGSTLALAYAETYPENVSGLILRGVFTSTTEEINHFYHGGTAVFFPEVYEKLTTLVGDPAKKNFPAILLEKMQDPNPKIREKYARAWAAYEGKIASLEISDNIINAMLDKWSYFAFSIIENFYMANHCFLKEGQLLKHADKIKHIPTIIINGRYDVVCPPVTAYKLHKILPQSQLIITEKSGHSAGEQPNQQALIRAAAQFE